MEKIANKKENERKRKKAARCPNWYHLLLLFDDAGAVFAMIKFDVIGELQIKEKWKKVKFFPSNLIPFPFILLYV